jgi:hypothetical protein
MSKTLEKNEINEVYINQNPWFPNNRRYLNKQTFNTQGLSQSY